MCYILLVCVCSIRFTACSAHAAYCYLWLLWLYSIVTHYLVNGMILEGEKHYWKQNVYFDFLYNFCLKHFWLWEELSLSSQMYTGLHVKYALILSDFNKNWIFSTHFRKIPNVKFNEIPSIGCRIVLCGRADVTKLIVVFASFRTRLKWGDIDFSAFRIFFPVHISAYLLCERNV